MGERIHGSPIAAQQPILQRGLTPFLAYFVELGLSHDAASELHLRYYKTYGLALRGLVKHHDVGEPKSEGYISYVTGLLVTPRSLRF